MENLRTETFGENFLNNIRHPLTEESWEISLLRSSLSGKLVLQATHGILRIVQYITININLVNGENIAVIAGLRPLNIVPENADASSWHLHLEIFRLTQHHGPERKGTQKTSATFVLLNCMLDFD